MARGASNRPGQEFDDDVLTIEETKTQQPKLFKVLLHNDDYTPMEFVVMILETIFHKNQEDAVHIMLNIHHNGIGMCGVYTAGIAETKVSKVQALSTAYEYPLKCSMEPE